jgi:large subunit ribosomal protein L19
MNGVSIVENEILKKEVPSFRVGDSLKIHIKVREGNKTRIQIFEGTCIRKRGSSVNTSFTVVKESYGEIVEKIFPLYSPSIEKIDVKSKGKTRRAKLYYLRKKK